MIKLSEEQKVDLCLGVFFKEAYDLFTENLEKSAVQVGPAAMRAMPALQSLATKGGRIGRALSWLLGSVPAAGKAVGKWGTDHPKIFGSVLLGAPLIAAGKGIMGLGDRLFWKSPSDSPWGPLAAGALLSSIPMAGLGYYLSTKRKEKEEDDEEVSASDLTDGVKFAEFVHQIAMEELRKVYGAKVVAK